MKRTTRDISGQTFNYLTAIKFTRIGNHNKSFWEFKCICGKVKEIAKGNVISGGTRSCGCVFNRIPRLSISGERYGKLVVLERKDKDKWFCQCDCGNKVAKNQRDLRGGRTKSCGCITNLPNGEPSRNQLFSQMRFGAKRRNLKWGISLDEFAFITSQNCFYCGSPPKLTHIVRDDFIGYAFNGIDRVDNKLGYIHGNIVPCCKFCNIAKNDNTVEDFKSWVKSVCSYWANK